jgi:hypothetical protein
MSPKDCIAELGAENARQREQIAALHARYMSSVLAKLAEGYALSGSRQM